MANKITLKNAMVYDFMRKHSGTITDGAVKSIFEANKDEIAKQFGITTYQTFNFHVRKCLDWESKTGNRVNVIRMDNEGVVS